MSCLCGGTGTYRVSRWNALDAIYEVVWKACVCVAKKEAKRA
jgi:hypothetical protein